MKNLYMLIAVVLFLNSCTEKKTEFIQSNVRSNLFLIKNPPKSNSLLKKEIIFFLIKKPPEIEKFEYYIDFYKYTYDTKYFLKNEEYDGFGAETLSQYNKDLIASFNLSHCKNDTTKYVGELYYYGVNFNLQQIDTLIYKCN